MIDKANRAALPAADPRVVWLTARLLLLEQIAVAAEKDAPSPWRREGGLVEHSGAGDYEKDQGLWDSEGCRDGRLCMTEAVAALVVNGDPRRVLARVEADRALMKLHTPEFMEYLHDWNQADEHGEDAPEGVCAGCVDVTECPECSWGSRWGVSWPCATFKAVLSAYRWAAGFEL